MSSVGLLLPTREGVVMDRPQTEPLLDLAREAERAGLDSVWVGESPLVRARHDALTLLAAVAARTSRIAVGSAVLLAPLRHPLLLLHQAATVDQLSRGRLVLGLGAGYPMPQTRQQLTDLQVDHRTRGERLEDAVRLAGHLWRRPGSGRFEGRTMALERPIVEPGPHRPGGPPIWLAGSGPAALRRVGRLADGWLPYPPTPERYADELAVVRRHAEEAGRPVPTAGLYVTVAVDADPKAAARRAAEHLERCYDLPADLVSLVQAVRAGTHDEVRSWLRSYRDAGAQHVVVRIAGPVDPEAVAWLASVRAELAREAGRTAPAPRPPLVAATTCPSEDLP